MRGAGGLGVAPAQALMHDRGNAGHSQCASAWELGVLCKAPGGQPRAEPCATDGESETQRSLPSAKTLCGDALQRVSQRSLTAIPVR